MLGTLLMSIDGLTVGLQAIWYKSGLQFRLYYLTIVGITLCVTAAFVCILEQNWRWLGEKDQIVKAQMVLNKIA